MKSMKIDSSSRLATARNDGKIYGHLRDNAGIMRHIIVVLIALMALCSFVPLIWAAPAAPVLLEKPAPLADPAQTSLITTPSMASFLNDSWVPSTFVPPTITALTPNKQGYLANTTYGAYDFLNDTWVAPSASSPIYYAQAPKKDGTLAYTGESIYQFLQDNWTSSTPVEVIQTAPYKKGVMS